MINRRKFIGSTAAGIAVSSLPVMAQSQAKNPNIIFILAEELGWGDLGCYGRTDISTPFLDSLATDGMKFNNAYANSSTSQPSRISLVSGLYPYRTMIGQFEPGGGGAAIGLEPSLPKLSSTLKKSNYQTAFVGRWHMGGSLEFGPLQNDYDYFWGVRGGVVDYFTHDIKILQPDGSTVVQVDLWEGDEKIEEEGYLTDLIGKHGAEQINRMASNSEPFLLNLHFTAPHWPWQGPDDEPMTPQPVSNLSHNDGGSMAIYKAMVESMDSNVGRILGALEATGQADNTIIVFTTPGGGERFSRSWPYNGFKGEVSEGGIRSPLLVRWPDYIPKGLETDQATMSMDWLPTFLDASNIEPDAPMDGMSLMATLQGAAPVERLLFWRHKMHDQAAARQGKWKYMRIAGTEYLFDTQTDPQERANRIDHEPEIFASLKSAWEQWNNEMIPYPEGSQSMDAKGDFGLRPYVDRY